MGKRNQTDEARSDSALVVTAMFVREANISDLWKLDVLGITDPAQTKPKEVHQQEVKDRFRQTVTFYEGRYKVPLPGKETHSPLLSNKESLLK